MWDNALSGVWFGLRADVGLTTSHTGWVHNFLYIWCVWHGSACIGVACITATKFVEAQCASATVRRFDAGHLFGKQKEVLFRLPSVRFIRVSHVLGPVAMHETACGGIAHSCLFPVSVRYWVWIVGWFATQNESVCKMPDNGLNHVWLRGSPKLRSLTN